MGARRHRGRAEAIAARPSEAAVITPITPPLEGRIASSRMQYIGALNAFIERLGL